MPVDLVRKILLRAAGLHQDLTESTQGSFALRRSEALAQGEIAMTLLAVGDLENALVAGERGRKILIEVLADRSAPGVSTCSKPETCLTSEQGFRLTAHLGAVRILLGDIYGRMGRRDDAVESYNQAIEIFEQALTAQPDLDDLVVNLSLVYGRLAEITERSGDTGAARELRAKIARLNNKTTTRSGEGVESNNVLALRYKDEGDAAIASYKAQTDTALAQQQLEKAIAGYRKHVELRRAMTAKEPTNTLLQRELFLSLTNLGNGFNAGVMFKEAVETYEEAVRTIKSLSDSDPGNREWRSDLVHTYNRLGEILFEQDDRAQAVAVLQKAVALMEKLIADDPANLNWQNEFAETFSRLGEIAQEDKRYDEAVSYFQQAAALATKSAKVDPKDPKWQSLIAYFYEKQGDAQVAAQRPGEAINIYRESVMIREGLVQRNPQNADWQSDLAVVLFQLALAGDQPKERIARGLGILQLLPKDRPSSMKEAVWLMAAEQELRKLNRKLGR
jgi:tetratricopeptide (TPR) repeat protein